MSMIQNSLPNSVTSIDLKSRLIQFDEEHHLINIAEETRKHYSNKKKKNASVHQSPQKLKIDKGWQFYGKPAWRGVQTYDEVKEIVKNGQEESFMGLVPNDEIYGIPLWNRTDNINFNNVINNLDAIGGMDWNSLYIKLVYFEDKFISTIGNHCTVKTIIMCGEGALIPCRIVCMDEDEDAQSFMARQHDIDANKRTNMNPTDRLVSQAWSNDPDGEKKMQIIISLGYNVKDQVVPNGLDLLEITSYSYLLGYISTFGYDDVKFICSLMRKIWKKDKEHHAMAIGVLVQTYSHLKEELEKHSKKNNRKGANIFEDFMKWQAETCMLEQSELFRGSGKEKSLFFHAVKVVGDLNKYCKSKLAEEAGYPRLSKCLIGKQKFLKNLSDDDMPSNIDQL